MPQPIKLMFTLQRGTGSMTRGSVAHIYMDDPPNYYVMIVNHVPNYEIAYRVPN